MNTKSVGMTMAVLAAMCGDLKKGMATYQSAAPDTQLKTAYRATSGLNHDPV
jgi:hypothetical protein